MKKLFLIVDYQNDFVADGGKLSAGAYAQALEDIIVARINAFQKKKQDVLCTMDTHTDEEWKKKHAESGRFPLHCVEDSLGWQLYGKLADMDLDTVTKTSFMLDQTDIDWLVRQYDVIELAGVSTDICILQNAIGLYNHAANLDLKVKFRVAVDCVAAFDEASNNYSLDYMQRILGFELVTAEESPV